MCSSLFVPRVFTFIVLFVLILTHVMNAIEKNPFSIFSPTRGHFFPLRSVPARPPDHARPPPPPPPPAPPIESPRTMSITPAATTRFAENVAFFAAHNILTPHDLDPETPGGKITVQLVKKYIRDLSVAPEEAEEEEKEGNEEGAEVDTDDEEYVQCKEDGSSSTRESSFDDEDEEAEEALASFWLELPQSEAGVLSAQAIRALERSLSLSYSRWKSRVNFALTHSAAEARRIAAMSTTGAVYYGGMIDRIFFALAQKEVTAEDQEVASGLASRLLEEWKDKLDRIVTFILERGVQHGQWARLFDAGNTFGAAVTAVIAARLSCRTEELYSLHKPKHIGLQLQRVLEARGVDPITASILAGGQQQEPSPVAALAAQTSARASAVEEVTRLVETLLAHERSAQEETDADDDLLEVPGGLWRLISLVLFEIARAGDAAIRERKGEKETNEEGYYLPPSLKRFEVLFDVIPRQHQLSLPPSSGNIFCSFSVCCSSTGKSVRLLRPLGFNPKTHALWKQSHLTYSVSQLSRADITSSADKVARVMKEWLRQQMALENVLKALDALGAPLQSISVGIVPPGWGIIINGRAVVCMPTNASNISRNFARKVALPIAFHRALLIPKTPLKGLHVQLMRREDIVFRSPEVSDDIVAHVRFILPGKQKALTEYEEVRISSGASLLELTVGIPYSTEEQNLGRISDLVATSVVNDAVSISRRYPKQYLRIILSAFKSLTAEHRQRLFFGKRQILLRFFIRSMTSTCILSRLDSNLGLEVFVPTQRVVLSCDIGVESAGSAILPAWKGDVGEQQDVLALPHVRLIRISILDEEEARAAFERLPPNESAPTGLVIVQSLGSESQTFVTSKKLKTERGGPPAALASQLLHDIQFCISKSSVEAPLLPAKARLRVAMYDAVHIYIALADARVIAAWRKEAVETEEHVPIAHTRSDGKKKQRLANKDPSSSCSVK